jgi:hypothetical protein
MSLLYRTVFPVAEPAAENPRAAVHAHAQRVLCVRAPSLSARGAGWFGEETPGTSFRSFSFIPAFVNPFSYPLIRTFVYWISSFRLWFINLFTSSKTVHVVKAFIYLFKTQPETDPVSGSNLDTTCILHTHRVTSVHASVLNSFIQSYTPTYINSLLWIWHDKSGSVSFFFQIIPDPAPDLDSTF